MEHWKFGEEKTLHGEKTWIKISHEQGAFIYKELCVTDIFSKKGSINTRNIEIS